MANTIAKDQQAECPECQFGPFTRNNYFTGKLMTARDFTDESRYHSERMRHHNARLHGWGVVCGLKVKAHENANCHDRFVVIEPGTALDCCGNEILVTEPVIVELATLPAVADLIKNKVTDPHRLQVCISYRECPTEEVPVLYDECGCDDARCAPNRILSSFSVDAILDGALSDTTPSTPSLSWDSSLNPSNASQVVLDSKNRMMYAAAADQQAVYQIDVQSKMVVGMAKTDAAPLNMAVSNNGDRLYVVTAAPGGAASAKPQLLVLDTAKIEAKPLRKLDIAGSEGGGIDLAVAPDNRLFALSGESGKILSWPAALNIKGKKVATVKGSLGGKSLGLTLGSDGRQAYLVDAESARLVRVDIKDKSKIGDGTPLEALPAEAAPSGLALVSSTGPDLLAVISSTQRQLSLVDAKNDQLLGRALLDHPPLAVTVSPGGEWAYVLEADKGHSYVQAVSLFGLQKGATQVTGEPLQVADDSRTIVASPSGDQLYIPYEAGKAGLGGVGVVKVSEADCRNILWRSLDGCPGCETPNCVVLATIENYVAGFKVEDPADPAPTAAEDQDNQIARIDNVTGRKLLPSTEVLTELVECLLEQGCGDCTGTQGPPGDPGVGVTVVSEPPGGNCEYGGLKVTDGKGQVSYVCNGEPGTDGLPGVGVNGKDGVGLEPDLTRIKALSWKHDTPNNPLLAVKCLDNYWMDPKFTGEAPGIVIGFTRPVLVGDPHSPGKTAHEINAHHVFQAFTITIGGQTIDRAQLRGVILPVKYTEGPAGFIVDAEEVPDVKAEGVAFIFQPGLLNLLKERAELMVRLQGDFVLDEEGRAVDAEYVRADLETGDHPKGSDFGVQGGPFESWFWTKDKSL
jgi:DNA-binding beta-propeller fold protein YncE